MASDDEPKPRSLRDIAARAKEATARQSVAPPPGDTADLFGALQARPSTPPLSSPPGTLISVPPPPATGDHGPAPTIRSSGLPPPPSRPTPSASVRPPSSFPGAPETQRAAASLAVGAPEIAAPVGPPPAGASADEPRPAAPVSMVGVQVTTTEGGHKQEQVRRSMMPVLAAVGAVAIAGLVAVMMRHNEPLTLPAGMASASAAMSAAPAASSAAPAASQAPVEPAGSAAPADSGGAVDINALASADAATQARVAPTATANGAATATATATATTAAAVASASAAPRPMGSVGDLQDEMRRRVGATDTAAAPEQAAPSGGNPDAKQDKPSTAAVSGALGAVRGGVKACLADTDKPTRVSVVFQSDGSVRSVSVSGGAAGKADACVIAAVKKARVAPFVADSFSTSFSVSP